jgi:hypothetical protein
VGGGVVVVLGGGVVVVVGCGVVAEAGVGVRMTKGLGVDMAKRIGAANMLGAAVRGGDPDFVVAGSGAANRSGVAVTDHPPGCVATAPLLTAKPVIPTKEAATISATGYLFAKSARNSGCRAVLTPGVVHCWPSQYRFRPSGCEYQPAGSPMTPPER